MYMFGIFTFLLFITLGFYVVFLRNSNYETKKPSHQADTPIKAKILLTEHEKAMFQKLKYLPDCHVFCQVSLGAILKTKSWKTRNKFAQKIADFVVTDLNFNVLAVIELDDKSHDQKQEQDQARDNMLKEAGYKVLRYRVIPNREQLAQDILPK